jgi:hypothetical protein
LISEEAFNRIESFSQQALISALFKMQFSGLKTQRKFHKYNFERKMPLLEMSPWERQAYRMLTKEVKRFSEKRDSALHSNSSLRKLFACTH